MTHLSDPEFVDLVEGRLAADRSRHTAACDACRAQADAIRDALNSAQRDAVPEPSPLFWVHFSARVSDAIGKQRRPFSAWTLWLREGGLGWAFAAVVVLIVAGLAGQTLRQTDQLPLPVGAEAEVAGGASLSEQLLDVAAADAWDAILLAIDDLQNFRLRDQRAAARQSGEDRDDGGDDEDDQVPVFASACSPRNAQRGAGRAARASGRVAPADRGGPNGEPQTGGGAGAPRRLRRRPGTAEVQFRLGRGSQTSACRPAPPTHPKNSTLLPRETSVQA